MLRNRSLIGALACGVSLIIATVAIMARLAPLWATFGMLFVVFFNAGIPGLRWFAWPFAITALAFLIA